MCGLVGCVGKIWSKEEAAFKTLLQLDTIRGPHSTGVLSVLREKGMWAYEKEIGTAWDLMNLEVKGINIFDKLMRRTHGLLLGHNRFATKGRVTAENAHPFEHGGIVGAHNGTLTTQWQLKDYNMFDVDSDNIFYNIAEEGVEETLKKLNGAFALTWYDSKDHTVSLVRNDERPLCFCFSKDNKTLFWASESWMLHIALQKAGIEFKEVTLLAPKKLMVIGVPTVAGDKMGDLEVIVTDAEFYKPVYDSKPHRRWDTSKNCFVDDPEKKPQAQPAGAKGTEKTPATVFSKVVHLKNRRDLKTKLISFCGKDITFSVDRPMKDGSLDYLLCDIEDEASPPELRIFVRSDSALYKLLTGSSSLFKAKVTGHTISGNCDGGYIRVDHRTIEEIDNSKELFDEPKQINDIVLYGHMGKKLSLEEFYSITNNGCAACGDIVSPRQCRDLVWINSSDFFCPDCKDFDLAKNYPNYINQD